MNDIHVYKLLEEVQSLPVSSYGVTLYIATEVELIDKILIEL